MKHIQPYRIFERRSTSDIEWHLSDICLELKDIGFNYIIDECDEFKNYRYVISIVPPKYHVLDKNVFEISEIIDTIDHINSYMSSEGFKMIIHIDDKHCPNMGYLGKKICSRGGLVNYDTIQKKDFADIHCNRIQLNFITKDDNRFNWIK